MTMPFGTIHCENDPLHALLQANPTIYGHLQLELSNFLVDFSIFLW